MMVRRETTRFWLLICLILMTGLILQVISTDKIACANQPQCGATIYVLNTTTVYDGKHNSPIGGLVIQEDCPGSLVAGRSITLTLPEGTEWDAIPEAQVIKGDAGISSGSLNNENKRVVTYNVTSFSTRLSNIGFTGGTVHTTNYSGDMALLVSGTAGVNGSVIVATVVKDSSGNERWFITQTADPCKEWIVRFNHDIDFTRDLRSSVLVYDASESLVDVVVRQNGIDQKSLVVEHPPGGYERGKTYCLAIEDTINDLSGQKLKTTTKMKFTISTETFSPDDPVFIPVSDEQVGTASFKQEPVEISLAGSEQFMNAITGKIDDASGNIIIHSSELPAEMGDLQANTIFLLLPTVSNPTGMIGKIASIDGEVFTISQPDLQEVFSELNIDIGQPIGADDIIATNFINGVQVRSSETTAASDEANIPLNGNASKDIIIEITEHSKLGIHGTITLSNSTLQAVIDQGWFGLNRLALVWTGDMATKITLDGTIHDAFDISQLKKDEKFKFSDAFSKDQLYLGCFTVGLGKTSKKGSLGLGANIYLGLTANGELAATLGYTVKNEEWVNVGFDYVAGQPTVMYDTVQSNKNEQSWSLSGKGTLNLAVSPGVGLLVGLAVPALVQVNVNSVTSVKGEGIFRSLYPNETTIEITSDGYIDVMARAGMEATIGPVQIGDFWQWNSPHLWNFLHMEYKPLDGIIIVDPNLEQCLRKKLNKSVGPLYKSDLEKIYELNLAGKGIINLDGLDKCINLKRLDLRNNHIFIIEALRSLSKLTVLYLAGNQITDYTPSEAYYHNLVEKDFGLYSDALYPVEVNGLWGYIDYSGKMVIQPQFNDCHDFSEGLAAVEVGDKWGYINNKGQIVIQPQFGLYDQYDYLRYDFSEGLVAVEVGDKWGYMDTRGQMVISPQFSFAYNFSEGLAAVEVGGKWGYIDTRGQMVISPQFSFAYNFSEGLAWVGVGDKWGYIDKSGQMVIPAQFECADSFSEGLAEVRVGNKSGYINKSGQMVIPPQFEYADRFSEGMAAVDYGGRVKYGYIDTKGNLVIQPQFDWADSCEWGPLKFTQGLAAVNVGGKFGYIDNKGQMVIQPQFVGAGTFSEGLAWVNADYWKWGYIDKTGRKVWWQP